jgi:hypothetical protein
MYCESLQPTASQQAIQKKNLEIVKSTVITGASDFFHRALVFLKAFFGLLLGKIYV